MSKEELNFLLDILKNFSPRLFWCLEWRELFHTFFKNLKRGIKKTDILDIEQKFKTEYFVLLLNERSEVYPLDVKKLDPLSQELFNRELVRLYFTQILHERPFYFNFLEKYFYTDSSVDLFYFKPLNGFQSGCTLDENFKIGLTELYKGLYEKKDNLKTEGLIKMGLLKKLVEGATEREKAREIEKRRELFLIVESHFGSNINNYFFDLKHLSSTMKKLTDFVKKNKIKIDSNFILFFLCLTSLYLCLQGNKKGLNLEEIYFEVKP